MPASDGTPRAARQPHVMTIAGSDSGGGAGIQADLKTMAALGCYGSSVITGLTAQNTIGVDAVHEVPPEFVLQQLQSVFSDEAPEVIKLGMLTSSSTVSAIAKFIEALPSRPPIILDPVMISTSGHALLPDDAIQTISTQLLPHVDWITPNIPEGKRLADWEADVTDLDDMLRLSEGLAKRCNVPVILLKGGHLDVSMEQIIAKAASYTLVWEAGLGEEDVEVLEAFKSRAGANGSRELVVDILVERGQEKPILFVGRKVQTSSTHGTGCTLSSALACVMATTTEKDSQSICERATEYTRRAIRSSQPFGKGHGPLNHSHAVTTRAISRPNEHDPHPFVSHLIASDLNMWKAYIHHPFVKGIQDGTLPRDAFQHYIKQDYHYLRHYARAHSLGGYKSSSFSDITAFTGIAQYIAKESTMHVSYCSEFGISQAELDATPESAACAAYARYILDVGNQGDILDLYVAVASCLIGYGEVGLQLQKGISTGQTKLEGNIYRRWIEDYSGSDFQDAVHRGIENLERRIAQDPPSPARLAKLTNIWQECVRLERDFWDMGMNKSY